VLTGLPWDITAWTALPNLPPSIHSYAPRRVWSWVFWDCRPLILQNGTWLASIYVQREGFGPTTSVVMSSTDKGKTWAYLSTPMGTETNCNEASMIQLPNGHIMWAARRDNGEVVWYYCHSTDNGATWNSGVGPRSFAGGASVGFVAPALVRLDNGIVVCFSGRQNDATVQLGCGVCADGTETGLGLGGYSLWQRKDFIDHINLYTEAAADTDPMKIRAIIAPRDEKTTCYIEGIAQSSNRILLCWDQTPYYRQTNRAGTLPGQLYHMDMECTPL
jgi:hypothetical protein